MGLKLALVFFFFFQGRKKISGFGLGSVPGASGGLTVCYQHDILPIWQNIHLCCHISNLLSGSSESPHLDLTFKSSHVGALDQEWRAGINHCTHFNLNGSHTSPILLCLGILLIWRWYMTEVFGYAEKRRFGTRTSVGQVGSLITPNSYGHQEKKDFYRINIGPSQSDSWLCLLVLLLNFKFKFLPHERNFP